MLIVDHSVLVSNGRLLIATVLPAEGRRERLQVGGRVCRSGRCMTLVLLCCWWLASFKVVSLWRLLVRALGVQVIGGEEQSRMRFRGARVASVSVVVFILGHSGAREASPLLWIGTCPL